MKRTATESLIEDLLPFIDRTKVSDTLLHTIIEGHLEMEKEQIFESWDNGFDNGNYYGKYNENCEVTCGKQYYEITFKSK